MIVEDRMFLAWLVNRLTNVYGEDPHVDFVIKLRRMADGEEPMELSEAAGVFATVFGRDSTHHYEQWVEKLWGDGPREDVDRLLGICGMGLPGEAVEFLEELLCGVELIRRAGPMAEAAKKAFRDGRVVDRDKFIDEAGDILYYLVKLLHWQKATLTEAMEVNQMKINERYKP